MRQDFPEMLDSMRMGTNRIVDIIRSLRTFSRSDTSHWEAIDLHGQINDTLTLLKMRLKGKYTIDVVKDYGDVPPVECYSGQLSQVFMNLLSNAIDAINTVGEQREALGKAFQGGITILTESSEETVLIHVSDNGPGIDPETQHHLFDSFFTTKAVGKGTGLGLAIARRIMTQKHQGTITCTSCTSGPEQGTTFTLTLPIQISSPQAQDDPRGG